MTPHVESGDWKMGGTYFPPSPTGSWEHVLSLIGALLNEVPADDNAAGFDFFGSTLVCKAESKEAILEQLKKDIYATSGVWDLEKVPVPQVLVLVISPRQLTHCRSKFTPSFVHSETHKHSYIEGNGRIIRWYQFIKHLSYPPPTK
jgi:hypothetical protein